VARRDASGATITGRTDRQTDRRTDRVITLNLHPRYCVCSYYCKVMAFSWTTVLGPWPWLWSSSPWSCPWPWGLSPC